MDLRKLDIANYKLYQETSAGGVVLYKKGGKKYIVVIEREKVRDISLPKGHQRIGESLQKTAIREVLEETGFKAEPRTYLGSFTYVVKTSKCTSAMRTVHWFLMEVIGGKLHKGNKEVKRVKLIPLESTFGELSYDNDRDFVKIAKEDIENKLPEILKVNDKN